MKNNQGKGVGVCGSSVGLQALVFSFMQNAEKPAGEDAAVVGRSLQAGTKDTKTTKISKGKARICV
jgi:hypothetical protein